MQIFLEEYQGKTYKTKENANKAVLKVYPDIQNPNVTRFGNLRYFIMPTSNGRFYPVFVGNNAIQYGTHFHFFTMN